jgi:hypothetical protein
MTRFEREHGHAKGLTVIGGVDAAETHELVVVEAERFAQRTEMLVDEGRREPIVSCRHRRMGREDDLCRDSSQRFPCIDTFDTHPLSNELERREGAMTFVQVQDAGRDAERAQHANATNAEQQFLADPDALVAAVQPRGKLAILRLIAFDVRIEQQQRVASDQHFPHTSRDAAGSRLNRDVHLLTAAERRANRQRSVIEIDVIFVLPAVSIEPLPEVPLVVVQPDADEW